MVNSIFSATDDQHVVEVDSTVLKDVAHARDFKNRLPKSYPVEAFELYEEVGDILSSINGFSVESEKLLVPTKNIRIVGWREKDKEAPLVNHLLESHVGAMRITKKSDKEKSIGVAIASSSRGITIAYGTRVFACHNQCVFGSKIMRTFGSDGLPYERMIDTLKHWAHVHDDIRKDEFRIIDTMKSIEVGYDDVRNIVGDLYITARTNNANFKMNQSDMNVNEVGKLTDAVITSGSNNQDGEGGSIINGAIKTDLWSFYNDVTEILNPRKSYDPVSVFDTTDSVTQYLFGKYDINVKAFPSLN